MGVRRVKLKLRHKLVLLLTAAAALSATLSSTGMLPANLVETLYARRIYPHVSEVMARIALPFSWLDVLIPLALFLAIYFVYRRKFIDLLGLVAVGYLVFFWGWGLNYHRVPLESKLDFSPERVTVASVRALAEETASALNGLYAAAALATYDQERGGAYAHWRVSEVVAELDGTAWVAASTVKSSRILDPFFRASGVDGMFNPFGHEALVTTGLLSFESPMVALHEVAHVRGYPDEGDANFIALMAAVNSSDAAFQYSGWLTLWLYLRTREWDPLLEEGPRRDVEAVYDRVARNRIDWISRAQTRSLDMFLKAHDVDEGIASYADIVNLAVGTRTGWDRFRE